MAKDDKKVLLVAQEIKLAKILAGNNKKLRDRTLKRLGKWLVDRANTAPVNDDVFMRIWKGLFYSMWMSDKPLVQEQCAEDISKLVHFNDTNTSLLFFKCFLQTMMNEWFGIDHHRIDKFYMLVRRVFRQSFEVLKNAKWSDEYIKEFREILNQTALKIDSSTALGLILHVDEIFLEELAKVSRGKLAPEQVLELIQPFAQQLARLDDIRHVKHLNQHIFKYLMDQSDVGIEYKEKFHFWRRQGFPGGTMDTLEKVELQHSDLDDSEDDEEDEGPKDPRAGKVDVVLPQLQFDPSAVADLLESLRFKTYTTSVGRKQLGILIQQFKQLSNGKYPLGATKVAVLRDDGYSTNLKHSVKRLQQFENSISKQSKKQKKRKLKQNKVQEIVEEQLKNKKDEPNLKVVSPKPIEFQDFVAKSEAKIMKKLQKNKKHSEEKIVETLRKRKHPEEPVSKKKKPKTITKEDLLNVSDEDLSKIPTKNPNIFIRNSGIWVVEEFDVPETPQSSPNPIKPNQKSKKPDEWSKPLQNGETEYFVVSSKMKKKRLSNKTKPNSNEELNTSTQKLKTPKKSIVKNPFSTPKSEKKIKFSDKNHAQDFSDHLKQIMSSPGIPYDSKKKPNKPLLKPSPITSPINPFYRKMK